MAQAVLFASDRHSAQKRKYTGEPYFIHLAEVAYTVAMNGGTDAMIAAAYLHDSVEDAGVEQREISELFGNTVSGYVYWLTDATHDKGNRAARKEIDLRRLAMAPPEAKTIKLADMLSNTQSVVERDPKFAKVYLPEKRAVLGVLTGASSPALLAEANRVLTAAEAVLQRACTSGPGDAKRTEER